LKVMKFLQKKKKVGLLSIEIRENGIITTTSQNSPLRSPKEKNAKSK